MKRVLIRIRGRVQGVGFRPYVYNLAKGLSLRGFVKNSSKGVTIDIEGERVDEFIERLKTSPPPLSEIEDIKIEELPVANHIRFRILQSEDEGSFTHVSPDVYICDDCLKEMLEPSDRRYLYPFINCTNCGPRYSITLSLPYDRPNTTMRVFKMCEDCLREYEDPGNRRFHAQPNACAKCGPCLEFRLINSSFKHLLSDDPLKSTIDILQAGGIVAIKGLGGFHIACDALNLRAVETLRARKRKNNKPFALMAPDIDAVRRFVHLEAEEERLLSSNRRPIVLLRKKRGCLIPEAVAPKNGYLGFMLPYTPLHYLLFYYPVNDRRWAHFSALVMTSGNLKEEPIIHKNQDAVERLSFMVDAFLFHNREIFMRVDDSVIKEGVFLRRARGYVPEPVVLDDEGPEVLAVGADLKNTFTLTKEHYAVVSQHIGDMENYETLCFFEEVLENLKSLYRITPVHIAADLHPLYMSRQWAEKQGLPVTYIQHHYAHAAAVMAEHGIKEQVFAVVLDGTGYGTDGTIWGSEVLMAGIDGFKRLAHFEYIRLPGAEMAIREPWRVAVSVLEDIYGSEDADRYLGRLGFYDRFSPGRIEMVKRIKNLKQFSPVSSGAGRLFDAVASLLGVVDFNTHEAEAPIALESLLCDGIDEGYGFTVNTEDTPWVISFRYTLKQLVEDFLSGQAVEIISTRFHNTLVSALYEVLERLRAQMCVNYRVVLSGGVFQNHYLLKRLWRRLEEKGFQVYFHKKLPPNDACISLGQAYILRHKLGGD